MDSARLLLAVNDVWGFLLLGNCMRMMFGFCSLAARCEWCLEVSAALSVYGIWILLSKIFCTLKKIEMKSDG